MTDEAIQQLREWAERGGRGIVMGLPEAVSALLEEREQRLTKESGLALIEDAKRWERAYNKARNERAELEEALTTLADAANRAHEYDAPNHWDGLDGGIHGYCPDTPGCSLCEAIDIARSVVAKVGSSGAI